MDYLNVSHASTPPSNAPRALRSTMKNNRNAGLTAFAFCCLFFASTFSYAQVSGVVFRDFNANGVKDNSASYNEPFAQGITVKAFDAANVQLGATLTTDVNGAYSFSAVDIPSGTAVRIEFSGLTGDANSFFHGIGNGTNIQFVTAPSTTINYAVNYPKYFYSTPAYISGVQNLSGLRSGKTDPGMFVFDWDKSGAGTFTNDPGNAPTKMAEIQNVGSLWGITYENKRKYLFASAVLRRHADLGPEGLGGIYVKAVGNAPYSASATINKSFTIDGISPANGGGAINIGSITRTGSADYTLGVSSAPNIDLDAFAKVGKVGIGDIEVDETGNTLWVVNLNQIALVSVDISGDINAFPGTVNQYLLSGLSGWPAGATARPWGLKFYRGKGYLGVVVTGENATQNKEQATASENAYILEFDPANLSSGFTTKLTIPLNYTNGREGVGGGGRIGWMQWKDAYFTNGDMQGQNVKYAQAIVGGIEFDEKGDMAIGLLDRWSLQSGGQQRPALSGSTANNEEGLIGGDILKACATSATTWALEGALGGCTTNDVGVNMNNDGPYGVGEFYNGDFQGPGSGPYHNEIANGSIIARHGTGEIANASLNPTNDFNRNGVQWYNPTTGARTDGYTVIAGDNQRPASHGKAAGLGDIELLGEAQPIQIGNRIWVDTDTDGIQDADETTAGVPNGTNVTLRSPGINGTYGDGDDQTWTTTTDANGHYYFSTLSSADNRKPATWIGIDNTILPGYEYRIEVAIPSGASVTSTDATTDDIDNDASASGGNAVITINTSNVNHNYDIGFLPPSIPNHLGNIVWRDDNSDGVQDTGEPGVAGINVTLYMNGTDGLPATSDDKIVGATLTDAYGNYLFPNLSDGNYNVKFTLPPNYIFTQTNTPGDNANNTNSDADISTGRTGTINLVGGETDLTVDAGIKFVSSVLPMNSIGDRVWYDTDGNGVFDNTEKGAAGVVVTLYEGTSIVMIAKTDAEGKYLFNNVQANTSYTVRFSPLPGTLITGTVNTTTIGNNTDNCDADATLNTVTHGYTSSFNSGPLGTTIIGIDCGLKDDPKASLGNFVWNDRDANAVQGATEQGVPNVQMNLYFAGADNLPGGGDDVPIQTTTTDASGYYLFSNLEPNTYFVVATVPTGHTITTLAGTNEYTNNDFAPHAAYPGVNVQTSTVYTLGAGQNYMGVDMGIKTTSPTFSLSRIGASVTYDYSFDGMRNNTEPNAPNITVSLLDGSSNPVNNPATGQPYVVFTDANGFYEFVNVPFGMYRVKFSNLPPDYALTLRDNSGVGAFPGGSPDASEDSDPNIYTGATIIMNISSAGAYTKVDAGIIPINPSLKASIGDKVWFDANNNGLQDIGETGVPNVTVRLVMDSNDDGIISGAENTTYIKTVSTDAFGNYIFDGLDAGRYFVIFDATTFPAGYAAQSGNRNVGQNDIIDSDGLVSNYVSLSIGTNDMSVDCGIYNPATNNTIGHYVWVDSNADGKQDTGEPGATNIVVNLLDNGDNLITSTRTDSLGKYQFSNLANGTYFVQIMSPAGYTLTLAAGTAPGTTTANNSDFNTSTNTTDAILLSGGTNVTDIDGGLINTRASLGNYVWYDYFPNGIQEPSLTYFQSLQNTQTLQYELPIAGTTVNLFYDADNNGTIIGMESSTIVATTMTKGNGEYFFSNLLPGNYQLQFTTIPAAMDFTLQNSPGDNGNAVNSDANPTTGLSSLYNLITSENETTADAGIKVPQLGNVGNFVWLDANMNGIQDAGEAPVAGIVVILKDKTGALLGSAVTNGDGRYLFTNVLADTGYTITFSNLPTGYAFTTTTAGTATGSDPDRLTGITASFTVTAGATNNDLDAGIMNPLNTLGNKVWRDDDSDGVQDAGEPGVADVNVTLLASDGITIIGATQTDSYGDYLFSYLPNGDYIVKFSPLPNYIFTNANTPGDNQDNTNSDADVLTGKTSLVHLEGNETDLTIDAGIKFVPINTVKNSIGDRVWYDSNGDGIYNPSSEYGVAGVTVTLYASDGVSPVMITKTDATGKYLFDKVNPNTDYIVSFSPMPGTLITGTANTTTTGSGTTNCDANATLSAPTYGYTTAFNSGVAGTEITGIDCGLKDDPKASLGDRVWNDYNANGDQFLQIPFTPNVPEIGIPNVTMSLYSTGADALPGGGDDALIQTTKTDALGNYLFSNLDPQNYFVVATVPTGFDVTSLTGVNEYSNNDFAPNTNYTGAGVQTSSVYNLALEQHYAGIDMGIKTTSALVYNIGNTVWNDVNKNGIRDSGEPTVSGVTVSLLDASENPVMNPATGLPYVVLTDENGQYVFSNLPTGDYKVKFSNLPANMTFTRGDIGGTQWPGSSLDSYSDSDAYPETGITSVMPMASYGSSSYITGVDVGIIETPPSLKGSIGNWIWFDANNNGLQDASETGVPNVFIKLYYDLDRDGYLSGAETASPFKTVRTDAQGYYLFDNLDGGRYWMNIDITTFPAGYGIQPGKTDVSGNVNDENDNDFNTTGNPQFSWANEIELGVGTNDLFYDGGIYNPTATNSIGDLVWLDTNRDGKQDIGEIGMPGIAMNLFDNTGKIFSSTVTDANGNYLFANLPNGTFSVQVAPPAGFTITQQNGVASGTTVANNSDFNALTGKTAPITLSGGTNLTDVDAGLISTRAALGNYVWLDANGDGVQDLTEKGLVGVTVSLYFDADNNSSISGTEATIPVATVITDGNGKYLFPNLTPGNYQVAFSTQVLGLEFTQQNTAGDNQNNTNSDANTSGLTGLFNLVAGEADLTVDAGLRPKQVGGVGDFVWFDTNENGVQDGGEAGVPGVIVILKDAAGNVIGTAITNGNGNYLFPNVQAEAGYKLIFYGLPNGVWFTDQITGSNDGSDVYINNGETDAFIIIAGAINRSFDAGLVLGINPFPIELLSFDGEMIDNNGELRWTTSQEINSAYFQLERSLDAGLDFETLGDIPAAGNSNVAKDYHYTDYNVGYYNVPKLYYRLKMVDIDGTFKHSNVVALNNPLREDIYVQLQPNPAHDKVHMELQFLSKRMAEVKIVNQLGQMMWNTEVVESAAPQTFTLDVSTWAKGIYYIYISTPKGSVVKKLIVE